MPRHSAPDKMADLVMRQLMEGAAREQLMRAQRAGQIGGTIDTLPALMAQRDVPVPMVEQIQDPTKRELGTDVVLGVNPITGVPLALHDMGFFGGEALEAARGGELLPALANLGFAGVSALGAAPGIPAMGGTLSRISTRFPHGPKATENPITDNLSVGLESMQVAPKEFAHNVNLVAQYDFMRPGSTEPMEQAEQFIEHVKSNLLAVHDAIPPAIRGRSKQWYVGANRTAKELAEEHGLSTEATSGIIAALSPQKDWFENREMARRVLEVWRDGGNWSKEMDEVASGIVPTTTILRTIRGKSYDQVTGDVERAWWIRAYDKAHNESKVPYTTPEGDLTGTFSDVPIRWGGAGPISKALRILDNPSIENISEQMGKAHKVRNFYNNIVDPFSEAGDVTIDTHAVAIGTLLPLGGTSLEVSHNLGSGIKAADVDKFIRSAQAHLNAGSRGPANSKITGNSGTYGLYAEAYRRAAAERGILPREMQSITWEGAQNLFTRNFKTAPNRRAARGIWREYREGLRTLEDAQQSIFDLAGGIDTPVWMQ